MKLFLSGLLLALSFQAAADITKPLPQSDPLAKVARAVGVQLADGNISTGTTKLWAGQVKSRGNFTKKNDFKTLVEQGFAEAFKDDREEALPDDAKIQVTVGSFVDGDGKNGTVHKMTAALIESNAYNSNSEEVWSSQARFLWAVLRKLPVTQKTLVGHAQTRVEDSSSGEQRTIQYFLLLNPNRKAIQFFTIEGTM